MKVYLQIITINKITPFKATYSLTQSYLYFIRVRRIVLNRSTLTSESERKILEFLG